MVALHLNISLQCYLMHHALYASALHNMHNQIMLCYTRHYAKETF